MRKRTCRLCSEPFHLEPSEKNNNRCSSCREKARQKTCPKCTAGFRDDSKKNTRRFCESCTLPLKSFAQKSDRTERRRRQHVAKGRGGRVDDFATLTRFSTTWWGRVGEKLFAVLYPEAQDAVSSYGNRAPFDFELRRLGEVNVKTAKASKTRHDKQTWPFQVKGVAVNADHAFLVGFSEDQKHVMRAWMVPSEAIPSSYCMMTPESSEYDGAQYEVSGIEILDRHFQHLLSRPVKPPPPKPERPEYERTLLGKVGEAIYKAWHPSSDHVAARNPVETFDFEDAEGTKVNVRVRRPSYSGTRVRWTFQRTEQCTADVYFFIGMDAAATRVEKVLRVPTYNMPEHGFSLDCKSKRSKWLKYEIYQDRVPALISGLVGVAEFDQIHLKMTATIDPVSLTPLKREALVNLALLYHRTVGFPYPAIPSDKKVLSEIESLRMSRREGDSFPVKNTGLGVCSAYMPHRFDTRNSNADFSAVGAFEDDDRLRRALRFCLEGRKPSLRRRSLRSALTALNRAPTQFRPATSAALCREFTSEGEMVFDPCAGWGGRLMGALATGRRYTGVDLSDKTCEQLYRLGSRLSEVLQVEGQFGIIQGDVLKVPLSPGTADFALTSPPYWTRERYEGSDATVSFEQWIEEFYRPFFERVAYVLKGGRHFALKVSDLRDGRKTVPLEAESLRLAERAGLLFVQVFEMQRSQFGDKVPAPEKVFVFMKR